MYRLFLWVIALSCGPGLQVTIYAKYWKTPWDSMMSKWESVHGPFVREYYYEGKVDKYFPQRTYSSDEDPELPTPPAPSKDSCEAVKELRFDCFPRGVVTEQSCVARGCCYQQSTGPIPSCFYPKGFASYNYTQLNVSDQGVQAELTAMFQSSYPRQKTKMYLSASFNSNNELLIIFSTTSEYLRKSSWYQPQRRDTPSSKVDRSYDFKISKGTLGFQIVRKSNGRILFDTQKYGGWLFSDQFAQISTPLPSKYIYGLEERANEFPLNTNWNTIALLNHDTVPGKVNGYGSYGAYFCLEGDGKAHSVEFGNSAPAEFRLQPGGLTARFLEPDFYITITLGDSPEEVFKNQISHSQVPPFWALGFHFSRFGFKSTEDFKAVVGRMKDARIPLDTMWTDIDYMDRRNDFTLSSHFQDLPKYVDELHENGMHYVLIIDPGVSGSEKPGTYPPYDLGIKKDIFIKDSYGKKPLVGRVWNPKTTVFPDFTHSGSLEYWIELIEDFHKKLKFDGIWLDMNEPSNFVNGSIVGCPSNRWENPPYVPEIEGGVLNYHTICMSAKHQAGLHYYLHNEHAALECIATCFALTQLRNERSFVISRGGTRMTSDFSGIWTGDVRSTWDDMKQSVRDIMTFNVLGQSLIGADICGFNGNTTQNLCRRWHQLGAFYPFSRNHNTDDGIDQDPIALKIEDGVRPALIKRYSLLPYLYTLFFAKSKSNLPVVRPTWYMFPDQEDAFTVDYQFFWGDAVLIVPALEDGLSYVKAYIGSGVWYDEESLMKLQVAGTEVVLPAPADHIPILIRGGNVIPTFNVNGSVTTKQLRDAGSIKLIVALDDKSEASGIFYWDDGVTFNPKYTFGHFAVTKGSLQSHMYVLDYKDHLRIDTVQVFATDPVTSVTVNSVATPFNYNQTNKVLTVEPKISLYQNFTMTWQ